MTTVLVDLPTGRQREVLEAFAHLSDADPVLAELIGRRPPDYDVDAWRLELPVQDLFGCFIFQVVGQQISIKASRAILGRLADRFGGTPPTSAQLARVEAQELRDLGFSWNKARTAIDLAARFADGRLTEARLRAMSDEEILAEMTQIKGVGPWTVHGALLIALERSDVVPVGDIMLANSIKAHYGLDHVPSHDEIAEIALPWRPYGSLGVNVLFAAYEQGW